MEKTSGFWERLASRAELDTEPMPAQPIIEIGGDSRVLVENHCGVQAYCPEEILIGLKFGQVRVCGAKMVLTRMSREQLLIRGKIDAVTLIRRDGK